MRGIPRPVEAVVALVALIVLSPLFVAAAVAVKLGSRGPVLFRQTRVGRGGRPFSLVKLRSMRTNAGGSTVTVRGDPRVTAVGRVLRRLKLDELPQLWNVLRGEMSLVGPRPEVPAYVDLDDPRWRWVLEVRPGLTDPVTLELRNEEEILASVDGDRLAFYAEVLVPYKLRGYAAYLERRTVWSDVVVLVRSLLAVVHLGTSGPSRAEIEAVVAVDKDSPSSHGAGPLPGA